MLSRALVIIALGASHVATAAVTITLHTSGGSITKTDGFTDALKADTAAAIQTAVRTVTLLSSCTVSSLSEVRYEDGTGWEIDFDMEGGTCKLTGPALLFVRQTEAVREFNKATADELESAVGTASKLTFPNGFSAATGLVPAVMATAGSLIASLLVIM